MLRVTIDLVSAITKRTTTLGTMFLANDGKGSNDRGNYDVRVMRKGVTSPLGRTTREGRVEDYPRLAYNVWRLIGRAVHAAFPEEREPGIAKLNSDVIAGMSHLVDHLEDGGHVWMNDELAAVDAAIKWLRAGEADDSDDKDSRVSDALGCNMPEGDAREAFQRSIFRGCKLLASGRDCDFTDDDRDDMTNARKFIEALPE